jgi:hypothetical protein
MKTNYKQIRDFYFGQDNLCEPVLHMNIKQEEKETTTTDPYVWGPLFWFSLHNGAINYPENASEHISKNMKGFIMGIPYMLPCVKCSEDAKAYIINNHSNLDSICSGREKLFKFFFDFHNYVNKKLGKSEIKYEDALKMYSGKVKLTNISYSYKN